MALSSFALLLGVFFYVYGFPLVFADSRHLEWREKILKDENALRIVGTILIALAVTTLRYHYRITPDGEGIVIVVAWISLVKGLFMAWWPRHFMRVIARFEGFLFDSSTMQVFTGCVMVLLGALFTFLGLVLA
jgi:hypothetical protein